MPSTPDKTDNSSEHIQLQSSPSELTVRELKSLLTRADVDLPGTNQNKEYYVNLFKKHIGDKYIQEIREESTRKKGRTPRRRRREQEDLEESRSSKRRRVSVAGEEESRVEEVHETSVSSVRSAGAPRRTSIHVFPKSTLSTRRASFNGKPITTRDLWEGRADIFQGDSGNTFVSPALLRSRRSMTDNATEDIDVSSILPSGGDKASTPVASDRRVSTLREVSSLPDSPTPSALSRTYPFMHAKDLPEKSPIPNLSPSRNGQGSPILQGLKYIMWILVLAATYTIITQNKSQFLSDSALPFFGPGYCDSEKFCGTEAIPNTIADRCRPCPIHGYCCGGKLEQCQEPFIRHRAQCVDPSKTPSPALHLATVTQEILANHAGRFECGQESSRGIKTAALRAQLYNSYLSKNDIKNATNAEEQGFEMAYSKMMDLVRDPVNGIEIDNDHIESSVAVKPLKCALSDVAIHYRSTICGIAFIVILVATIQVAYGRVEKQQKSFEDRLITALTRLRNSGRCGAEELRQCLVEDYGESAFGADWSEFYDAIENDDRVQSIEDDEGAVIWEWIDPNTSVSHPFPPRNLAQDWEAEQEC